MQIKVKKLHPEAKIPARQTAGAAGYDIHGLEEVTIAPGETVLVLTGLALELPAGITALVFPRGSLCLKHHLDMPHSVGVGDEDFRGEYKVPYRNLGSEPVTLAKHERIAQFVFLRYEAPELKLVEELSDTARGEGSFGSTGKG